MRNYRRLVRALLFTIAGSLIAAVVFNRTPWREIPWQTFTTMLFAGPCVLLCVYGLPIATPWARRHFPRPFDWFAIVVVILLLGAAGSLIGAGAMLVIGAPGPKQTFWSWYPDALKISLYFTLIFGVAGTMVAELRGRLDRTTVALRTKERDEAEARRLAAEAQLASLEARVDPHFLFNTLNSIAALVRDRPAEAERVIEQLSALMRSSLDRKQSLVPVDEELALVRSYLEIERVRFGDRLRFSIEPAAGAGGGLVPRLSLQTVVENSVKYAVSTARDGASIRVTAARDGERLRLTVEDDGPGFDSARLPEGHGLQLLTSRVAMMFEGRGDVRIASARGRTVVTLDVPFKTVPPTPPAPAAGSIPDRRSC